MLSALGSSEVKMERPSGSLREPLHAEEVTKAPDQQPNSTNFDSRWGTLVGILFTLMATLVYSVHYILSESMLSGKHAVHPQQIQSYAGGWAASFITAFLVIHTFPNFKTLVLDQVALHHGSWFLIIPTYLVLILSGFFHSVTFFRLLGSVGSVSTGILQSLRAVSVFAISAVLFCGQAHPNQCFNIFKGISTVVVVCGIMYFSKINASHQVIKKEELVDP